MKEIIISIVSILALLILIINYLIIEKNGSRISQGKSIIQKDTKKEALLVIDVQESITGSLSTDEYWLQITGIMTSV
jgi:hypothetical protein